jgi:spore coat polysaccharide biosynthesis protein SpsF
MTRKVGIVIQARVGSSRLPGKILKKVKGRPLLTLLFDRLQGLADHPQLICAIPDSAENEPLRELCGQSGVSVFAGPEQDVLKRYVLAARDFDLTDVVRITSDCPLLDPRIVEKVIDRHLSGEWDLTLNESGVEGAFPRGMDVEVVKASTLDRIDQAARESFYREHVTLYLYKNPEKFAVQILSPQPHQARPDLRLCIDEPADLAVVRCVFQAFWPRLDFSLQEIIAYLDKNPAIRELNRNVQQKIF